MTMKVEVSGVDASKPTYQWYDNWCDSGDGKLSGKTDSNLTITKGIGEESYCCYIYVDGEYQDYYYFYIYSTYTLSVSSSAKIDGEDCDLDATKVERAGIKKGTQVELSVSAESEYEEAELTYQWQKEVTKEDEEYGNYSTYEDIEDATSADYSFETSGVKEYYRCIISDGNETDYAFFIILGENTLTVTQAINGETYTAYDEENDTNYYSALKGKELTLSVTA